MQNYPIKITEVDLKNVGILPPTAEKNQQLLFYTHMVFYEFIVYTSMRSDRRALITKYKAMLEDDIKNILLTIATSVHRSGDFVGLDNGMQRKSDESVETKTLQERLLSVIPTVVFNQIAGLEPNILFCGGEI